MAEAVNDFLIVLAWDKKFIKSYISCSYSYIYFLKNYTKAIETKKRD